ncbi:MAG: OmpH family outer membrane protein [Bacteroidales bacterium]|nr:OmpH family outer membrane protein [Bacteroidales bacterium]
MTRAIGFAAICLLLSAAPVEAQPKNKFGHIDFAELYSLMPGLDTARQIFEQYNRSIQEQYGAMQTELENKYMDYEANKGGMSEIIRQTKEAEINDLRERMDAFEVKAAEDLQNRELELTTPIIDRAMEAIREVAAENGYTYIFSSSNEGLLLYAEPSDDIMPLVKKKLNITATVPETDNSGQ